MIEKITVQYECIYCKFEKTFTIKKNKYGFFDIPDYYCPNDLSVIKGSVKKQERNKND